MHSGDMACRLLNADADLTSLSAEPEQLASFTESRVAQRSKGEGLRQSLPPDVPSGLRPLSVPAHRRSRVGPFTTVSNQNRFRF